MDSIPLLCKICPEEPHFSDVSHLLTHISSKGHLYQCKNAQLRSHHDVTFRYQLEEYNAWYEANRIEHLLAQRMAQKDSKRARGKPRQPRGRPSVLKEEGRQQKPRRTNSKLQRPPAKPIVQDPIDPQLSLFLDPVDSTNWTGHSSPKQGPEPFDLASLHRTHAPQSRSWTAAVRQGNTSVLHGNQPITSDCLIKSDADEDSEIERPYPTSPFTVSYPDPSTLGGQYSGALTSMMALNPHPSRLSTPSRDSTNGRSSHLGDADAAHVLKLKGQQYPGMALFDSASPNSQRLRNQKKEHSLLAQMEQSASRVEPIEQIFFPEWTLKKARVITGNVESSPIQDVTPTAKRRRAKQGKVVLGELSTNIPVTKTIPRAPEAAFSVHHSQITNLEDPFTNSLVTLKKAQNSKGIRIHPATTNKKAGEWRLNQGVPDFTATRGFAVYRDGKRSKPTSPRPLSEHQSPLVHYAPMHCQYAQSSKQISQEALPALNVESASIKHHLADRKGPGRRRPDSMAMQNPPERGLITSALQAIDPGKENAEPMLDVAGKIVDDVMPKQPERITQRYFSVTENGPASFFNSLPPQMEFGGYSEHVFQGSSFNPLNPQFRQQPHGSYLPIFQQSNVFDPFQYSDFARGSSQSLFALQSNTHGTPALPMGKAKRTPKMD